MNNQINNQLNTQNQLQYEKLGTSMGLCLAGSISNAQKEYFLTMMNGKSPKTINNTLDHLLDSTTSQHLHSVIDTITSIDMNTLSECVIKKDAAMKKQICQSQTMTTALLNQVDLDKLESVLNKYDDSINKLVNWLINNNIKLYTYCGGDQKKITQLTKILGRISGYLNQQNTQLSNTVITPSNNISVQQPFYGSANNLINIIALIIIICLIIALYILQKNNVSIKK